MLLYMYSVLTAVIFQCSQLCRTVGNIAISGHVKKWILGDAYIYNICTTEKGCIFGDAYMHHEKKIEYSEMHICTMKKGLHIRICIYTPWKNGCIFGDIYIYQGKRLHIRRCIYAPWKKVANSDMHIYTMKKGCIFGDAYMHHEKRFAYSDMHIYTMKKGCIFGDIYIYIYTMEKGCIFGDAYALSISNAGPVRTFIRFGSPIAFKENSTAVSCKRGSCGSIGCVAWNEKKKKCSW